MHPRWDPEEFRRLRDVAVNDVEKRLRQGDDENLGNESLEELMFRQHPYGRLTLGHASDLKSLSLQELQQHAARVFTTDRLHRRGLRRLSAEPGQGPGAAALVAAAEVAGAGA